MSNTTDTIAALATPPGRGGVSIIRVSGPRVPDIQQLLLGKILSPRYADLVDFLDQQGDPLDRGIALYFPAPHSFTGESVLELQGHGGPVIMDMLLERVLSLGVRMARPGEFSERAFINDKLDLAQAEAISDLIEAGSVQAARAALRSLKGEFSSYIHDLLAKLVELRMYVEAAIDFPEEEIDFLADEGIVKQLNALEQALDELISRTGQGCLLREGMTVVIAGCPNAGKSSLLNCLSGRDSAIVTEQAGTTRDILREAININGLPLHIIDTAGLRESDDIVEQEGVRRAWSEIESADRILLLIDDNKGFSEEDKGIVDRFPQHIPYTRVLNKIDQTGKKAEILEGDNETSIFLSAKTGQGVDLLRQHLEQLVGYEGRHEGEFIARRRHLDALRRAQLSVQSGHQQLTQQRAGELLAEELHQAQHALNEITGEFSSDDLLGRIFSSFCIGK
ncbi:MAG: tRNA uridine-5-carboxymethylaminomethyl(34) synthesis GTPase MnmE [Gammaproteobacteria bacterium]|nr:tRNA uridine-5-carboxymethylaminomethyl(34) synthesis GTPase MnmE [Gammaproteobacteria bacterium]